MMSILRGLSLRLVPALALVVAVCGMPGPAAAGPLIRFTDTRPDGSGFWPLNDDFSNVAVSWTQSVASSNVSLSVVLGRGAGASTGAWYVTNAIGPGTTAANVLDSGIYDLSAAGPLTSEQVYNLNLAPRIVLTSGLSFAPGTYHLVLDGPVSQFIDGAEWLGDVRPDITLAAGFTLGSSLGTEVVDAFAPASVFSPLSPRVMVFEIDGDTAVVPLPASLPLMVAGLVLLGVLRRRAHR